MCIRLSVTILDDHSVLSRIHLSGSLTQNWQHLLLRQHSLIMTTIAFDSWLTKEQYQTPQVLKWRQ